MMIHETMILLALVCMVVTYFFPLTVASIASMVYMYKVGVTGHCISLSASDGIMVCLFMVLVVVSFIIDLTLRLTKKNDKKPQENKIL